MDTTDPFHAALNFNAQEDSKAQALARQVEQFGFLSHWSTCANNGSKMVTNMSFEYNSWVTGDHVSEKSPVLCTKF